MNSLHIIGNLTADPEMRTTSGGKQVCTFTVAVNRKKDDATDYVKVSAWDKLGELCAKYLSKGRKVSVVGPAGVSAYTGKDGRAKGVLEQTAREVEFLSPKEKQDDEMPWA